MSDTDGSNVTGEQAGSNQTAAERRRVQSKNPRSSAPNRPRYRPRKRNFKWSEEEIFQLGVGVQRYGHMDVDNLHKAVPTKSCRQIKAYIYSLMIRARFERCDSESDSDSYSDVDSDEEEPMEGETDTKAPPLDQWLNAFLKVRSTCKDEFRDCLSKTFLYISRYEPHPDPKDCGGVDYAALYEFLYLALSGQPVKALSQETTSALDSFLEEFSDKMKEYDCTDEKLCLNKVSRIIYLENATKRHYGKKNNNAEEGPLKSLMDIKGFNPLNVPYELLKTTPSKPSSSKS